MKLIALIVFCIGWTLYRTFQNGVDDWEFSTWMDVPDWVWYPIAFIITFLRKSLIPLTVSSLIYVICF